MIEQLDFKQRDEFIDVIGSAFREHPGLPPDPTGGRSKRLASSILYAFAGAPDAHLFGIRSEGRIDCAAFVYDAGFEPRGWRLLVFTLEFLRTVGWRSFRALSRVQGAKPKSDERQLELILLGTRIGCQQRGYGRSMIHHIQSFARSRGYASVVLEVAKHTPAYGFYLSEGFIQDKEIAMPSMPLCFLRYPVADEHSRCIVQQA